MASVPPELDGMALVGRGSVGGGAKGRQRRWWWVVAMESGVGEATEKHGEQTEPERVGSVPQISWKETNPHLEGIFYCGANPTLLSSIQTLRRMGRLRPGWLKPSNQTDGWWLWSLGREGDTGQSDTSVVAGRARKNGGRESPRRGVVVGPRLVAGPCC